MGIEMGNQNVTAHQAIEEDDAKAVKAVTGSSAAITIPNDSKINLENDQPDSIHQDGGKEFQSESILSDDSDYRKYPSEPYISAEFEELQEELIGLDNIDQIEADVKVINQPTPVGREKKEKNSAPDALPKIEQTVENSEADLNWGDENLTCVRVSYQDITENILNNECTKEHTTQDEQSSKADTRKINEKIVTNYDENILTVERSQRAINELVKCNQEMGALDFSKELTVGCSFLQLHLEGNVPTERINIYLDPIDPESGNSLDPLKSVHKLHGKESCDRDMSRMMPTGAWNEEKLEGGNIYEVGDHSFHNQEESSAHSKQDHETIKCQNYSTFQEAVQASKTQSMELIDENHEDHYLILTSDTSLAQEMKITDSTSVVAITDNEFADNRYGKGTEQETHSNVQDLSRDREFSEDISLEISPGLLDDFSKSNKDTATISNEDSGNGVKLLENDGYHFDTRSDTVDKLVSDHIKELPDGTISEDEDTYEIDLVGGTLLLSQLSESSDLILNILQLDHVSEVFLPELQQKPNAEDLEMAHDLNLCSSVDLSPNITCETCIFTSSSEEFRIYQDGMNLSVNKMISQRMLEEECTELTPNSASESGSSETDSVGNLTEPENSQEPIFQQNEEEINELTMENPKEDYSSGDLTAGTDNSALLCQQEDGEETKSVPLVNVECFAHSSVNKSAGSSSNNIALPSGGTGEHETNPPSNIESPKIDSFSSATSVLESELHVKEHQNDPEEEEAIIVNTAETSTVKLQSTREKDDKEMPLHQQQEDDRRQVFLEINDSGKDSKPSFDFVNQEVPFTESWEQNQGVALKNSANFLRLSSVKKQIAQPHRERGKQTAKSFFGSCMCCTTTAIS